MVFFFLFQKLYPDNRCFFVIEKMFLRNLCPCNCTADYRFTQKHLPLKKILLQMETKVTSMHRHDQDHQMLIITIAQNKMLPKSYLQNRNKHNRHCLILPLYNCSSSTDAMYTSAELSPSTSNTRRPRTTSGTRQLFEFLLHILVKITL